MTSSWQLLHHLLVLAVLGVTSAVHQEILRHQPHRHEHQHHEHHENHKSNKTSSKTNKTNTNKTNSEGLLGWLRKSTKNWFKPPPEKPQCEAPKPGEKLVWFIQHGSAETGGPDPVLDTLGEEEALNLRLDPLLKSVFSQNSSERAELIITAPARKTMQTAVLAFGDLLPNITWEVDPSIMGNADRTAVPELGTPMLESMGATYLLSHYSDNYDRARMGDADDRWGAFIRGLRERPEQRIIVVTFARECELADVDVPPGQVRMAAMTRTEAEAGVHGSGAFRHLAEPHRWPELLKAPECAPPAGTPAPS